MKLKDYLLKSGCICARHTNSRLYLFSKVESFRKGAFLDSSLWWTMRPDVDSMMEATRH
jgi:hypothetical protein